MTKTARWRTPPSLMKPLPPALTTSPGPDHPRGVITRPGRPLPAGTPESVLDRLHDELRASTEQRSMIARLLARGDGPSVLETATITIGANQGPGVCEPGAPGVFSQDRFRVPYASVAVLNLGGGPAGADGTATAGVQTAPPAGTVIAATGLLPAGQYTVSTVCEALGSAPIFDITNFGLYVGATQIGTLAGDSNALAASVSVTVPAGGAIVSVKAVGNGSAGIVYVVSLTADPISLGAAPVVVSSAAPQGSAPGGGQGQFIVPGNSFVALNMAGSALSIYGAAGTVVSYCVMTSRIQPVASAL